MTLLLMLFHFYSQIHGQSLLNAQRLGLAKFWRQLNLSTQELDFLMDYPHCMIMVNYKTRDTFHLIIVTTTRVCALESLKITLNLILHKSPLFMVSKSYNMSIINMIRQLH